MYFARIRTLSKNGTDREMPFPNRFQKIERLIFLTLWKDHLLYLQLELMDLLTQLVGNTHVRIGFLANTLNV